MKLADLDPSIVGRDAVRALVDHLHRVSFVLAPGITLRLDGDVDGGSSDLNATMSTLTNYAQCGLPVWDWTDHGMASDGPLSAISALYGSALGGLHATAIDVVDEVDPSDSIGLVLVAAAARIRLSQGVGLTVRELGALAGIGAAGVRYYVSTGELAVTKGRPARVEPADARRWLEARGVTGLETPTRRGLQRGAGGAPHRRNDEAPGPARRRARGPC